MGQAAEPGRSMQGPADAAAAHGEEEGRRAPARDMPSMEVIQDDDSDEPTPLEYGISSMSAVYTLESLHQKWRSGDIRIPKLQRGYVWSRSQASKLIESFMAGLPVPQVFLASDGEGGCVVIDGMQRLSTVFSYLDGRYPDDSAYRGERFRITGINGASRLYGKTFWDLGEGDQCWLKGSLLRAAVLEQDGRGLEGPAMREVFERLSMGGTPLAAQEVRNGIYAGSLADALLEMNGDKDWREILGRPRPDPRMKDVEMVLRCMALYHEEGGYEGPMKAFLSGFMEGRRDAGAEFVGAERRRFADTCREVRVALGARPFDNGRGQLRMPLFDSVFVAFARNVGRCPADARERFDRLRASEEFAGYSEKDAASAAAVRGRLRLARRMLFE